MKASLNFITLAVEDLERSITFYRDIFGWETEGLSSGFEDHCLFELENGLSVVLFRLDVFEEVTGRKYQASHSGTILCNMVSDPGELDEIVELLKQKGYGAKGNPKKQSWGKSFQFEDPDGHIWEWVYIRAS